MVLICLRLYEATAAKYGRFSLPGALHAAAMATVLFKWEAVEMFSSITAHAFK